MRKNILAIFLVCISMTLFAQDISLENGVVESFFDANVDIPFDIDGHTTIANNTDSDIVLIWERVVNEKTDTWTTYICIGELCYAPNTSTAEVTIPANGSIDLYFHAAPNGTCGLVNADVMLTNSVTGEIYDFGHYDFEVECMANQDITFENPNVDKFYAHTEDMPFDIDGHTIISNTTSAPIELKWLRVVNEKTDTWSSYICIGTLCYGPTTDSATLVVDPFASIDLYFHGFPNGTCGMIDADVMISNNVTGVSYGNGHYDYEVECIVGTDDILTNEEVKIFPNPTNGFFNIETSFDLNHVEVYNIVGQMIQRAEGVNTVDITSLPKGIYLVKAYDNDNRFKTVKLLKR